MNGVSVALLCSGSTGFQYKMLQGLLLPMPDLQDGDLKCGSEPSVQHEDLCVKVIFQFAHLVDIGFLIL